MKVQDELELHFTVGLLFCCLPRQSSLPRCMRHMLSLSHYRALALGLGLSPHQYGS